MHRERRRECTTAARSEANHRAHSLQSSQRMKRTARGQTPLAPSARAEPEAQVLTPYRRRGRTADQDVHATLSVSLDSSDVVPTPGSTSEPSILQSRRALERPTGICSQSHDPGSVSGLASDLDLRSRRTRGGRGCADSGAGGLSREERWSDIVSVSRSGSDFRTDVRTDQKGCRSRSWCVAGEAVVSEEGAYGIASFTQR